MSRDDRTAEREVRSADPELSPEANRILTEEARAAIGSDRVEVPADAPRHSREARGTQGAGVPTLTANRPLLIITFVTAMVVGAIISLVTGSWWALVAAVVVHAIGTFAVAGGAIQLTTQTEHVDPNAAARLEDEGVADPDRRLTKLVDEFAGSEQSQDTALTPSEDSEPKR